MKYSESTIRRRANDIYYQVKKGFQHFQGSVLYDENGNKATGYMVKDLHTGLYVWGGFNSFCDFLWDLDDVEEFLMGEYEALGLAW